MYEHSQNQQIQVSMLRWHSQIMKIGWTKYNILFNSGYSTLKLKTAVHPYRQSAAG